MGLLETEIKEIRNALQKFTAGKLTENQFAAAMAVYSQTEKRAKLIIQAVVADAKIPRKKILPRLIAKNLMGDESAIDYVIDEIGEEKVICIEKNNVLITREDCLTYSGQNMSACNDCDHFNITRRILLPRLEDGS